MGVVDADLTAPRWATATATKARRTIWNMDNLIKTYLLRSNWMIYRFSNHAGVVDVARFLAKCDAPSDPLPCLYSDVRSKTHIDCLSQDGNSSKTSGERWLCVSLRRASQRAPAVAISERQYPSTKRRFNMFLAKASILLPRTRLKDREAWLHETAYWRQCVSAPFSMNRFFIA